MDVIERARTGPSVPAGRYFAPPKCHPLITVAHETHQFPAGHLARTQPAGLRHVDGDVATPSSQILPLKQSEADMLLLQLREEPLYGVLLRLAQLGLLVDLEEHRFECVRL